MLERPQHPPADTVLAADRLGYCARGVGLLSKVSLTVRRGECLVVMGANGAGKSLLVRLLHGLIAPSEGAVAAGGARQAMVRQRPTLLRRSVRGNLAFTLRVKRVPRAERPARLAAALARARLADKADRPARLLSGGEQQRLALARALIDTPDVLFLDEPTASLDPAATDAVEAIIADAAAAGTAIILVTHDAGQARRLGDRLLFLHNGRIAETGPVDAVLSHPQSEAVRAFRDGRLFLEAV
ncbi:MAG: ATP-binding cassette domain-containing protein [Pseudomonadota bacterium]